MKYALLETTFLPTEHSICQFFYHTNLEFEKARKRENRRTATSEIGHRSVQERRVICLMNATQCAGNHW